MNMKDFTRLIAAPSLVSLSMLLAAPAPAANASEAPSRVVRFADLNLSTMEGATALHKRIQRAALEVCRESMPNRTLIELNPCRRQLTDEAVAQVNRDTLTAVNNGKVLRVTARR
jgi:UrcA family protein